ncbi:hypothetical protein N7494_005287 [Penicillium frequentans]|uniref:Clr5 domain-containing protein n=1 Tax=Penicillium frequentans TaxID=3151616 RepID=A0AAD6GFA2_9EURO|nr:hypothetical protein N7494_005287 [Penicillium glabrum]
MTPRIDLDAHKALILQLIRQQHTQDDIRAILRDIYGINISRTTLQSRLRGWDALGSKTAAMKQHVTKLLPHYNPIESRAILHTAGLQKSERTLQRIRKRLGVKLRVEDVGERVLQTQQLIHILREEDAYGEIETYGCRTLQTHLQRMRLFYPRERIYEAYRTIRPLNIAARIPGPQHHRGQYSTPGPNQVWHVDGHMKLEPFGIEIYAGIDGFSRYIPWVYIGVSARTAVSVMRQYLDCITQLGYQPRVIRSDLGTETSLMAQAHYTIRRAGDATVNEFKKAYWYGRSTENQRIEAWWWQLSQRCTGLFHVSFIHLRGILFIFDLFYPPHDAGLVSMTRPDSN